MYDHIPTLYENFNEEAILHYQQGQQERYRLYRLEVERSKIVDGVRRTKLTRRRLEVEMTLYPTKLYLNNIYQIIADYIEIDDYDPDIYGKWLD